MRSLFRAFEARGVHYLVISGQASVLYGAAFFSQDLDLWILPELRNIRRLRSALAALRARIHKLTPPLTLRNLRRGHGFHFVVPVAGSSDLYLDVMGRPPRVHGFTAAIRRAERLASPWGAVPVVGIEDLVELKKTNRAADYDVITRLALIRLAREPRPGLRVLRWAIRNIFRAEDLWEVVRRFGKRLSGSALEGEPGARLLQRTWSQGGSPSLNQMGEVADLLTRRAQKLQDAGRRHWLPLIAELRRFRAEHRLLPEGAPVAEIKM